MMADEEEVNFNVCAVLPAAGSGLRTGLEIPKQYNLILGRPLISYTIEAFERVSWIQKIVISVSKEGLQEMEKIVQEFNHTKVKLTLGGTTRHRSIFNGVKELSSGISQPPDVVIIHDAVRPFVDEDILKKVALAANKHGASGAVRPLVSTVIAVNEEGLLDHSLERSKYRASEMPQAFRFDAIYRAYNKCTQNDFEYGTECLHLALTYSGVQAMLVDGPDSLWKVTFKKDLFAAEAVLKELTKLKAVILGSKQSCLEEDIMGKLQAQDVEVKHTSFAEMKTIASPSFNVVVAVNRQDNPLCPPLKVCKVQEERPPQSSEDFCFSNDIFNLLTSSTIGKRTIVCVELSSDNHYLYSFKEKLKQLNSRSKSSGIQCFGFFIDTSCCNQEILPSIDCDRVTTMITEIALNTSDVLSGQVFQYLW